MKLLLMSLTMWLLVAEAAAADPAVLAPPAGTHLLLRASAKGVQIYTCQASGGSFAWTFKAPEATLRVRGRKVADHFAGPSWRALDGSVVVGEVAAKADAPRSDSIPWLLLRAKTHEGNGRFARVAFIQRLDTKGGVAPSSGCDAGHESAEAQVSYRARYVFSHRQSLSDRCPLGGPGGVDDGGRPMSERSTAAVYPAAELGSRSTTAVGTRRRGTCDVRSGRCGFGRCFVRPGYRGFSGSPRLLLLPGWDGRRGKIVNRRCFCEGPEGKEIPLFWGR